MLCVSFDLETTGLSRYSDDIVQMASVAAHYFPSTKQWCAGDHAPFVSLVHTERQVAPRAAAVTGIDNRTLRGAPSFRAVWAKWLQWLQNLRQHPGAGCLLDHSCCCNGSEDADKKTESSDLSVEVVLMGHNVFQFDLPVLIRALEEDSPCTNGGGTDASARNGSNIGSDDQKLSAVSELLQQVCGVRYVLDTLPWSRRLSLGGARLAAIHQHILKRPLKGAHDALNDARAVLDIVRAAGFDAVMSFPQRATMDDCLRNFQQQRSKWRATQSNADQRPRPRQRLRRTVPVTVSVPIASVSASASANDNGNASANANADANASTSASSNTHANASTASAGKSTLGSRVDPALALASRKRIALADASASSSCKTCAECLVVYSTYFDHACAKRAKMQVS
jgi:hypothetical protein